MNSTETIRVESSFIEAWEKTDRVFGWLTECEAAALYNAAMSTPDSGIIVEVGSFCGRSATLLAETGRRVICVDPLQIGGSIAKTRISEDIVAQLQSVVDSYPNVTWHRQKSSEAVCPSHIDLLYVDACHKYPFPLNDFRAFRGGLKCGSLAAFHDYGREAGVTKSVDELMSAGVLAQVAVAGSMYVGEVL